MMRAAVLTESGVQIQDVPMPSPGPSEILVQVYAGGLNRADLMVISGHNYNKNMNGPGTVLGFECAGKIVALGPEAKAGAAFSVGDRVMCGGVGCWAEYAVIDYGWADKIPDSMSWVEGATLSSALYTMHNAVVTVGRIRVGDSVLVQGASSGVGLMAMQIAKLCGASLVVGTSTNAERRAKLGSFGADLALDSSDPSWPARVLDATNGEGVDLVIDNVSGSTVNGSLACTRVCGRIVNVGRLGGSSSDFDFDLHARRRIEYVGVTFRTRSKQEVRDLGVAMRCDLGHAWAERKLTVPVDRVFRFEEVADALAYMQANRHFGKVVLEMALSDGYPPPRALGTAGVKEGGANEGGANEAGLNERRQA